MKTTLCILFLIALGYSFGILRSLSLLSEQRDRTLAFIVANPPGREGKPPGEKYDGIKRIGGTPAEIEEQMHSLRYSDDQGTTKNWKTDRLFITTAYSWLKSDADGRIRQTRKNQEGYLVMTMCILGMLILRWRRPGSKTTAANNSLVPS